MERAYEMGWNDGLRGRHDNIFPEMSPEWVAYERAYDEAVEDKTEQTRLETAQ